MDNKTNSPSLVTIVHVNTEIWNHVVKQIGALRQSWDCVLVSGNIKRPVFV